MSESLQAPGPHGADAAQPADQASPPPATTARMRFGLLLLLCVVFVALADWLFWGRPRGWTVGAYGLALTGGLLLWDRRWPRGRPALLVPAALVALLVQCVEEPGRLAVGLGVLALFSLAVILREAWTAQAVDWLRRWGMLVVAGWQVVFRDGREWQRAQQADGGVVRRVRRMVGGWAIPLVLTIVFLVLFAAANPVISQWLSAGWRVVRDTCRHFAEWSPSGPRVFMWVATGYLVWMLLRVRTGVAPAPLRSPAETAVAPAFPSSALVVRCLALFNLLFAVQTVLDGWYLWGGAALPQGLTYAQYAQRGAYPLLAAAILAAVFVLAAFRGGAHDRSRRWGRRLVYVWLAQNLLLVVSAAWRLRLYVDVYSLTRLRVAAGIWMLLVLCGLVWILVRIVRRRSGTWLVNVNVLTALVVLFGCAFVDFDGAIARFNAAHCREVRGSGQPIDLDYLVHLGPESLPGLVYLVEHATDVGIIPAAGAAIRQLRSRLEHDLTDWRGWTWRRQRLSEIVIPAAARLPDTAGTPNWTGARLGVIMPAPAGAAWWVDPGWR